ncbi:MAG: isopentenyl-diphosphate delta-isomerase [Marmoricola sp.]|nr:isopentenyl-diphosphate delta-isomerase [Marmoricola sp.]
MTDTVRDEVVLLDPDGTPTGTAARATVHDRDTPLHLAFSLHLLDADGRTLLTRRALDKRTWPGVWTNSCCGHPRPGEAPAAAARRRVAEELGIEVTAPRVVLPSFSYRAVDASGLVENELCPVHVVGVDAAEVDAALRPDPREVAETAWVAWEDLHGAAVRAPMAFSPWVVDQLVALGPVAPPTGPGTAR